MSAPHVVVVGGGFAGLAVCRELRNVPVRITLIDRRNHHLFQPLLYQVATAALAAPDIAAPLRNIFRNQSNVRVRMATVTGVDRAARQVKLEAVSPRDAAGSPTHPTETLTYDWLVVATGATHSYFGHPEWAEHARGLKTLEEAIAIRRDILLAYEKAEQTEDPALRSSLLTFVVIGGGPTGVELAGSLAEIAHRTMARNFRAIDPGREARVILLEREDSLLNAYPSGLRERARQQLKELGVDVRTGMKVTDVDARGVSTDGDRIEARTVLWAAGVAASPLGRALDTPLDRAGHVLVTPRLTVPGDDRVMVLGDLAVPEEGDPFPPIAPAAIQMGQYAGRVIRYSGAGGDAAAAERPPFRYSDKGEMATIGRSRAVARIRKWQISGLPAWLMWVLIHIFFLIGFRNRVAVLLDWAWAYLTFQRSARVILDPPEPDPPQ